MAIPISGTAISLFKQYKRIALYQKKFFQCHESHFVTNPLFIRDERVTLSDNIGLKVTLNSRLYLYLAFFL